MHEWLRIKMNTTSQSYLPMWFQYVKTPHLFIVPKWNKCLNWTFIAFYWEIYLISWKKKERINEHRPGFKLQHAHFFFTPFTTRRISVCAEYIWYTDHRFSLWSKVFFCFPDWVLAWTAPDCFIFITYKLINGI